MPQGPQDEGLTDIEFMTAFTMMAQIVASQGANILNAPTSASRVRDLARMNLSSFMVQRWRKILKSLWMRCTRCKPLWRQLQKKRSKGQKVKK